MYIYAIHYQHTVKYSILQYNAILIMAIARSTYKHTCIRENLPTKFAAYLSHMLTYLGECYTYFFQFGIFHQTSF